MFKKDDVESFIYLLVNLAKGVLPWWKVPIEEGDNYYGILQTKMNIKTDDLCGGLPSAFSEMYEYIRNLEISEPINYEYIENLLHQAADSSGFKLDVSITPLAIFQGDRQSKTHI